MKELRDDEASAQRALRSSSTGLPFRSSADSLPHPAERRAATLAGLSASNGFEKAFDRSAPAARRPSKVRKSAAGKPPANRLVRAVQRLNDLFGDSA